MIEVMAVVLLSIASPDSGLVESLRKCRGIEDELARLECFDEAFILADERIDGEGSSEPGSSEPESSGPESSGPESSGPESSEPKSSEPELSETVASAPKSSTGSRSVDAEIRPAGGAMPAIAVVPGVGDKHLSGRKVELVARCEDGDLSVYIDWGLYLSSAAPVVTVKIDSLSPSRSSWARSEDKHASLFKPAGGKEVRQRKIAAFLRELMAGQRLAARVIPSGQTAVTAAFDLSGAKTAFRSVRKACIGF